MNSRAQEAQLWEAPAGQELGVQEAVDVRAAAGVTLAATPLTWIKVWDLPTRLFHWSLVLAFTVAVVSGELGGDWMALHGKAGLTIVGLVAFRLVWGVVGSTYARFASFAPTPARLRAYASGRWEAHGHNPLGALSVFALLLLLGVQATSGLFANDDIAFNGPLFGLIDADLASRITAWHRQIAYGLFALVGLHVVAIFAYLHLKKHNLITPMVTGWKKVSATAGSPPSARRAPWLALVAAIAVGVGAVVLASGVWIAAPAPQASVPAAQQAATPAW